MKSGELKFGDYRIFCEPDEEWPVSLWDESRDEMIDCWKDMDEVTLDIDMNENIRITLEEWQKLWDWAEEHA